MAIRNPTTLAVDFNADLKTENAHGRIATNRIIASNMQLPFGSYTIGSVDLTVADSPMVLGNMGAGVILSSDLIDVITSQSVPVTTKLFAYDGDETTISITTDSTNPITVEYAIGMKLPAISDAPISVTAVAGDTIATVSFTQPYYDGGKPIDSYTVKSSPDNITVTGTASPITVTGLINGTSYTFTAVATNDAGNSLPSTPSNSITPIHLNTVPGMPSIAQVTAGVNQIIVDITPPEDDGGSDIIRYTATVYPGGTTANSNNGSNQITITELDPGVTYVVRVTALNAIGISVASVPSDEVTLPNVPGAPTISNVSFSGRTATLTIIAPTDNGGRPITEYIGFSHPSSISGIGTSDNTIVINNLVYGTEYTFTAIAFNAVGASVHSAPTEPMMITSVPAAPVFTNTVVNGTEVTFSFTTPANNGLPITGYQVSTSDGEISSSGIESPITITGLVGGQSYTFIVRATNDNGYSPASAPTAPIAIITVPDAPTIAGIEYNGLTRSATISITPPANNGGSPITSYVLTPAESSDVWTTSSTTTIDLENLEYYTTYSWTVMANNAIGLSQPSEPSPGVVITGVPDAPIIISVDSSIHTPRAIDINFNQPTDNGLPITSYVVTRNPGAVSTSTTTSPVTVDNLTGGIAYTFTVRAINNNGSSLASAASEPLTIYTEPDAPTNIDATPADASVIVTFDTPVHNGGGAISLYHVTSNPDNVVATGYNSPILVSTLTNGTAYTFTVTAVNEYGESLPSLVSNSVTPVATPGI